MKKIAMTYGLISGGLMGIIFALYWLLSGEEDICAQFATGQIIGYASMVLSLLVIFPGVKQYRDKTGGGTIRFGRALGVGMLITLVAAIIFVIFDFVYLMFNPDFFSTYIDCQVEAMQSEGQTKESIDRFRESQAMFQGPMGIIVAEVAMLLTVGFIGLVISLISAAILKRP